MKPKFLVLEYSENEYYDAFYEVLALLENKRVYFYSEPGTDGDMILCRVLNYLLERINKAT